MKFQNRITHFSHQDSLIQEKEALDSSSLSMKERPENNGLGLLEGKTMIHSLYSKKGIQEWRKYSTPSS